MQYEINCPVCGESNYKKIVLLKDYPLSNLELSSSQKVALSSKVYDMDICMCKVCSHIYNRIPVDMSYETNENFTYYTNETQKKYIINLADNFINKYNVRNNRILEIGSGDGLFLKELHKKDNICIGYEPSYFNTYKEEKLLINNCYFDPLKNLDINIDFIVFRHVLEHFSNPYVFINNIINQLIKNKVNCKFFIEVPNIQPTLDNNRINDFIHEHISHFSLHSLKYLLNRLNLNIEEIYTTDNDENLVAICSIDEDYILAIQNTEKISNDFNYSIDVLQNNYQKILDNNKTICIWGAEGRGAGFIKIIKSQLRGDELVVDSDEKKFHKYIPSAGLMITDYKKLSDKEIDTIIITTALGKNNILQEIQDNNIIVNTIYELSSDGLKVVL